MDEFEAQAQAEWEASQLYGNGADEEFPSVNEPEQASPSLLGGLGTFAAGGARSLAGLVDLVNSARIPGLMPKIEGPSLTDVVNEYLPPKPTGLGGYIHSAGEFVGPNLVLGPFGYLGKAKAVPSILKTLFSLEPQALLETALASQGAEAAKNYTGNETIAPILGAVGTSAGLSGLKNAFGTIKDAVGELFNTQTVNRAAQLMRERTGLTPGQIDNAISAAPKDELGQYATTAEVTQNPGMAEIQRSLSLDPDYAGQAANRATQRAAAREQMLSDVAEAPTVNREVLGEELAKEATTVKSNKSTIEDTLWNSVDKKTPVDVTEQAIKVLDDVGSVTGGEPIRAKTARYLKRFTEGSTTKTLGELQGDRSEILKMLRDKRASLNNNEIKALSALETGIREAIEKGAEASSSDAWKQATAYTRDLSKEYRKGTLGRALTTKGADELTLVRSATKGNAKSIRQLKSAINEKPELLDKVTRAIVDEAELNAKGMKGFLVKKGNALEELLPEEHFNNIKRVADDLASEEKVTKGLFTSTNKIAGVKAGDTFAGAVEKAAMNPMLWRLSPIAAIGTKIAKEVAGVAADKKARIVKNALFRAAMDPEYAKVLASAPDPKQIASLGERFERVILASIRSSVKGLASVQGDDGISQGGQDEGDPAMALEEGPEEPTPQPAPTPTEEGKMLMNTSDAGIEAIKKREGLKLSTYKDTGGKGTIGYGHTGTAKPGQTISEEEADKLFWGDIRTAESAVDDLVKVPLTQKQYDALVSFAFNVGRGAFAKSTLLKKLNAGEEGVAEEFDKWVKVKGSTVPGLQSRRKEEGEAFG